MNEIMTKNLDELLCQKYPEIFRDRHAPMNQTAMCWGFACGDGWFTLIDVLCASLMASVRDNGSSVPVAVQVKEKFGGLRFYVNGGTETQDALIAFAEDMSYRVCEDCGTTKDAKLRRGGWHRTLCSTCALADGRQIETESDDSQLWGV
jgi:hypothetical protein